MEKSTPRKRPATTGISFKAPSVPKKSKSSKTTTPTKKGIRKTWTGGVEMHAGSSDNTTLLEEELDDVNHALSSDSDDETQKVGKKKFTDDYEETSTDMRSEPSIDKAQGEEETNEKRFIDDQEFTGFNLKDEKEEGKFEDDGNFTWEKDENDHADEWLAKVDWKGIDNMNPEQRKKYKEKFKREHAAMADVEANVNSETSLKDIVEAMKLIMNMLLPHENVAAALKRLRPVKKKNTQKRNKYDFSEKKKVEKVEATEEEKENAKQLIILSDAANKIAGVGYYDVYSDTLTQLNKFLEKKQSELKPAVDDDLDLFGDDDGEKSKPKTSSVQWEYKWGESSTENFGPFSTDEMIAWKEAGFFENTPEPVFCRRVSTEQFYSIGRTDFELYS